jgi:arginine/lysine/ornithine decarboxylase
MKHPRKYPMVLLLLKKVRATDDKRARLKEAIMAHKSSSPAQVLASVLTWM